MHECRHTFASLLIDANVNPKAIQAFMGHATIEMTFDRYGHLMPGSREQARERMDRYMEAADAEARVEAAAAGGVREVVPQSPPPDERFPAEESAGAEERKPL